DGAQQVAGGVPEHLRDHGRDRYVQGQGPRQHGQHRRRARIRDGQGAVVSRPRSPARRPRGTAVHRRDPHMTFRGGRLAGVLAAAVLTWPLAACSSAPDAAHTLNVLAGSELRDIEPLLPDLEKKTGIHLNLTYIGTLEGAERIVNGDPADAAWFSHGKYIQLLPGAGSKIVASEKIALSPVVIGVKKSVADRFGWGSGATVTWKDIQAKASDGSFRFAMTNPAASNSGFTALIGVAAALSGSSDSLDTGHIDTDGLKAFFKGQTLTAGSSGFLADAYVREQGSLDGLVNYESILLSLNRGGK